MILYIPSKTESEAERAASNLVNYEWEWFDGNGHKNFSNMTNRMIDSCPHDLFLYCSSRMRPLDSDIDAIIENLESGFAMFSLYRYGLFGLHRSLVREIGGFDERIYASGDDWDFTIRMRERGASYSIPLSFERAEACDGCWGGHRGIRAGSKWKFESDGSSVVATRILPEPILPYQFGPECSIKWQTGGGSSPWRDIDGIQRFVNGVN